MVRSKTRYLIAAAAVVAEAVVSRERCVAGAGEQIAASLHQRAGVMRRAH